MAGRPIDEKIVVMKLDNSDFTNKAAQTTGLLGKLRDSLNKIPGVNLGKTAQELSAINKEAGNANVNGLASSLQNISSKFTAMGVVATTTLATITSQAVAAGISLTKSLTLDPIMDGFREYETKMGSIQTILANTQSKGTTLKDVKASLEELNTYADKTIYSFSDMTRNIGLFTNAGLGLKESTAMIKGFSNAAAASGTNAEQAAGAAYQLSQGLSSGYIMAQDWMSLTNAGMGNDNMKRDLIALGQAMGTLGKGTKVTDDTLKDWKGSLSDGKWLTSTVMSTYLQAMTGDMDEATLMAKGLTKAQADLLLQNAKTGLEAATYVRTFTQFMGGLKEAIGSGWATTFEIIFGDFDQATKLWTGLSNTIGGWFQKTSEARNNLLKGMAEKGGMDNIFAGIQNAVKPVIQVFSALGEGWSRAFPPTTVDRVVALTEKFKSFTAGLALSSGTVEKLSIIFEGVFALFSDAWIIIKKVGSALTKLIPSGLGTGILDLLTNLAQMSVSFNDSMIAGNGLTATIDGLGKVFGLIGKGITGIIKGFSMLGETVSEVWSILAKGDFTGKGPWEEDSKIVDWLFKLRDAFKVVGDWFKNTFKGFGFEDIFSAGALVGIVMVVKRLSKLFDRFGGIFDTFKDSISGIADGISGVFGDLGDSLKAFTSQVKYNKLVLIAIAISLIAASLKILEGIKSEDIAKGIGALTTQLAIMMGAMAIIDKFNLTGGFRASASLIAMAIAVDIMASALKKIADLNPDQLQIGIAGLVGITATLAAALIAISKWGGKMKTSSLQLIALSGAIYILADAVQKMSTIPASSLLKSIGAMGIMFAELALFLKVVDRTKLNVGSAIGLIAVAAAVEVMVMAIQKIDSMDTNSLIKGLGTIAIILAEIALFSKVVSGGTLIAAGVGMIIIAGAINALVGPITTFSNMSWEQLAKGLGAMAVALVAVGLAAMLASGTIGGAIAIAIMAGAMMLLMVPMEAFANMSWEQLAKGFVGLAGGLLLMAGAALLLTPAVPSMLAFGAGLVVMGAGIALIGAGIALFAVGLATLATLTAVSVAAIVGALGLLLQGFVTLIPAAVNFIVQLGLALINGLVALVPPLVNGIAYLIIQLLTTITTYLPQFIELGTKLILQFLDGMGTALPQLIDGAIGFIVKLVNGMADAIDQNSPAIIGAVLNLIGAVLNLVIEAGVQTINALFGWIPGVKDATTSIGKTAEKYIRDNFGAKQTGQDKGKDFADGLNGKKGDAQNAGKNVGQGGKDGASSADLGTVGGSKGLDFANALSGKSGSAHSAGVNVANSGRDGMGSVSASGKGADFGQGFANGISSMWNSVYNSAKSLAISAKNAVAKWIDSHSPSKVAHKLGGFFGQGFSGGIDSEVDNVAESSKNMALTAKDSLNKFIDGFQLPVQDNELHFKAVVDYDKIDPSKFGNIAPITVQPDTSLTNGLVATAKADLSQNGNKTQSSVDSSTHTTTNEYNIKVETKGISTRAELRKLAEQIQTELKNLNDRTKISRGEEVAF